MRGPDAPRARPLRVLLVGDSEDDVTLVLRELRRGGYEPRARRVDTAGGMERALGGPAARGEPFEVVISDYHVPRFGAPDALVLLRKMGCDTPFIVVSGKVEGDAAVGMMRAGANDCVTKEDLARLCPAIERELRGAEARRGRAEAERKLKESEARLRTLAERLPDVTHARGPASPRAETPPGLREPDGLRGDAEWTEILHPEDREGVFEEDRRADETGESFRRDGRVVGDEAVLARDGGGGPPYRYGVTGHKRVEEDLRESEERYRTYIDQSTEGIWRVELEPPIPTHLTEDEQIELFYRRGYLAECNDAMARMYGFGRADELAGIRIGDLLPRSEPANIEYLRSAIRSGYRLTGAESREVDREGNAKYFLNNLTGILENGLVVRAWGTQRDVTEQRLAEEELRLKDRAVAASSNGILITDPNLPDNPIVYVNPAFELITGYTAKEALGRNCRFLQGEDRDQPAVEELRAAFWEGRYCTVVLKNHKKDGTLFWNELSVSPVRDGAGRLTHFVGVQNDITERKRAEEALCRSEARLQNILDNTTAVIYVKDEEGRYALVNRRYEEVFRQDKEQILGKTDHDLFPKEAADELRANDEKVLRSEVPLEAEETVPHDDGAHTYFSVKFPLRGPDGVPYALCGISTDITGRKRAEEALRQSEELYRSVVEQAAESIFVVDGASRRVLEANPSLHRSLGYEPEELRRMTLYDIVAHDRGSVDLNTEKILAGGHASLGERRYRRKDGSLVDVEVNASAVPYGGREAICIVAHDVTGRKLAEEHLKESEERYRSVVEQSNEGIFLIDARTRRILETNPSLRRMLGYAAGELRGMEVYDLVAHDTEDVEENIRRILKEKRFFVGGRRYRHKDGKIVAVEAGANVISHGGREVICAVLRDVTERKRAEEALREAREAERDRIARDLHDDVLQDIAHALQEVEVARINPDDGGALDEASAALRRSVDGLRGAIYELRLGEAPGRSFVSSLEDLLELNRRMVRGEYELELTVEDGFPTGLSGRAGRETTRIVREALANARRHARAGRVRVRLGLDGDLASVEVADDGRGFDPERSRFGVGRHSMLQRARELGGELEVRSEPGRGTLVRLRVPVSRLTRE